MGICSRKQTAEFGAKSDADDESGFPGSHKQDFALGGTIYGTAYRRIAAVLENPKDWFAPFSNPIILVQRVCFTGGA